MESNFLLTIQTLLILAAGCTSAEAQTCPEGAPRVAPDSRYIDHGDGTVSDSRTGLMWKRCSEGQSGAGCTGTASSQTWQQALGSASTSSFAGHTDWRLPNVKELQSLVETGCRSPSINTTHFPNTESFFYWSSTTVLAGPTTAFAFAFDIGSGVDWSKSSAVHVRLVRAGQ